MSHYASQFAPSFGWTYKGSKVVPTEILITYFYLLLFLSCIVLAPCTSSATQTGEHRYHSNRRLINAKCSFHSILKRSYEFARCCRDTDSKWRSKCRSYMIISDHVVDTVKAADILRTNEKASPCNTQIRSRSWLGNARMTMTSLSGCLHWEIFLPHGANDF